MPSIADVVGDGLIPADHGAGDFRSWDIEPFHTPYSDVDEKRRANHARMSAG